MSQGAIPSAMWLNSPSPVAWATANGLHEFVAWPK